MLKSFLPSDGSGRNFPFPVSDYKTPFVKFFDAVADAGTFSEREEAKEFSPSLLSFPPKVESPLI